MKLFQVTTDRDGNTVKAPGISETEIIYETLYYAADNIEDVWNHISWIRNDPERVLIAIAEAAPQVTVVKPEARRPE